MTFHQVVVDSYAAQHPGTGERRQVQSVGIHLMTLCLFLEHNADPRLGTELHRRMIGRPTFHRIEPAAPAPLNVLVVPVHGDAAATVREAAFRWARAVWDSYEQEHFTVVSWLAEAGFTLTNESGQEHRFRGWTAPPTRRLRTSATALLEKNPGAPGRPTSGSGWDSKRDIE